MKRNSGPYSRWILAVAACLSMFAVSSTPVHAYPNLPPVITFFDWINIGGSYFIIYGTIEDEDPETCVVTFSGAIGNGYQAYVESDGSFYQVVELISETYCDVDAICTDSDFAQSEVAGVSLYY